MTYPKSSQLAHLEMDARAERVLDADRFAFSIVTQKTVRSLRGSSYQEIEDLAADTIETVSQAANSMIEAIAGIEPRNRQISPLSVRRSNLRYDQKGNLLPSESWQTEITVTKEVSLRYTIADASAVIEIVRRDHSLSEIVGGIFRLSRQARLAVRDDLLAEAITDAKAKAVVIAGAAGIDPDQVRLWSVRENAASSRSHSDHYGSAPMAAMMAPAGGSDDSRTSYEEILDGGSLVVSEQVNVIFRLPG